jgi:hypothetical protein
MPFPWVYKPRQSPLYEFGERSRPYLLESRLMSSHAGQRQNVIRKYKRRGIDIEGVR